MFGNTGMDDREYNGNLTWEIRVSRKPAAADVWWGGAHF